MDTCKERVFGTEPEALEYFDSLPGYACVVESAGEFYVELNPPLIRGNEQLIIEKEGDN